MRLSSYLVTVVISSSVVNVGLCAEEQPDYRHNIAAAASWVTSSASSLPDGAILFTSTEILPYYSNLAAIGLTKDQRYKLQVKAWMNWYVRHLNKTDKWGLSCTVYDYDVSGAEETPRYDADSTDSYAATFLSLAWAYWDTRDPGAQAYIRTLKPQLQCIGDVIARTQQSNGLTWAKPDYQIQYLMDNAEVYKGLSDAAKLFRFAFRDIEAEERFITLAEETRHGIEDALWDSASGDYLTYVGAPRTSWGIWYPDSTAQLFPILEGVLAPDDPRAKALYTKFNANWPNWTSLSFPDAFPWALVSNVTALMGDKTRVDEYIESVQDRYVDTGFPWPWYSGEAGWFIRVNAYMLERRCF